MAEIVKALIAARSSCSATVHKAGNNQAQGYKFVGHEHVLTAGARKALLENGLLLEQVKVEFLGEVPYQTRNGEQKMLRWRGLHKLVHVSGEERGYEFEATTAANDKAAYVASTALDRVAHLRLLELAGSAEENPEHDSHEPKPRQERKERAERQQATKASPKGAAPALDEYQIPIPDGACPTTGPRAPQQFRGKPWTDVDVGWLIEKWYAEGKSNMNALQVAWAEYAIERRRRRKEAETATSRQSRVEREPGDDGPDADESAALAAEQEEAERFLGQREREQREERV